MKTLLRSILGIILALAAVTIIGAPAHAVGTSHVATAVATGVAIAFTFDPLTVVQFVIAFIMPVLVGLVTTRVTSGARKAWLLAGLSLASSLLFELARAIKDAVTYDFGVALLAALPAFVIAVAGYYGLWKPTGVADAAQTVGMVKVDVGGAQVLMTRAQYREQIARRSTKS